MPSRIPRREFLKTSGQGALTLALPTLSAAGREDVHEFRRGGMLYRRLGKTDLVLSVLSFGSHTNGQYQVPDPKGHRQTEEGQARRDRQIDRAMDLGVNLVDVYDDSSQWDPMARLIKGKRDKVLISLRYELAPPMRDFIEAGARRFGHIDLCRLPTGDCGPKTLEDWDVMRKAKAAGKIRAIGISTHEPDELLAALTELEGLDFFMFPYNFIHGRVAHTKFIPAAIQKGVGLLAIKPLGGGSIVKLDPRRPRPQARREIEELSLYTRQTAPLLEQAVAKLRDELDRSPEETLAQAALRFVFSKTHIASTLVGMWLDEEVEENYQALRNYADSRVARFDVLEAARELASLSRDAWLPDHYRWLDQKWKAPLSSLA